MFASYRDKGAPRVRVVGQVPDPATGARWDGWVRYEAAVNQLYAPFDVWGLCPYDTRSTPGHVLADVERTHAHLAEPDGRHRPNPRYTPPTSSPLGPRRRSIPWSSPSPPSCWRSQRRRAHATPSRPSPARPRSTERPSITSFWPSARSSSTPPFTGSRRWIYGPGTPRTESWWPYATEVADPPTPSPDTCHERMTWAASACGRPIRRAVASRSLPLRMGSPCASSPEHPTACVRLTSCPDSVERPEVKGSTIS